MVEGMDLDLQLNWQYLFAEHTETLVIITNAASCNTSLKGLSERR